LGSTVSPGETINKTSLPSICVMNSIPTVPWYHYTNRQGLEGILREGQIEESLPGRGDAREGRGTYGTNLQPSKPAVSIAKNNWDGGWNDAIHHGKMDHYLRCEIPRDHLRDYKGHGSRRDGQILVHPGHVDLTKYPTKFGQVGRDHVTQATSYDPSIHKAMYPNSSQVPLTPSPVGMASFALQMESDSADSPHHTGVNSAGNYYESYNDGSYHYENQDGSTYTCHADGHAEYTSPDGAVTEYDVHHGDHEDSDADNVESEGYVYSDGCQGGGVSDYDDVDHGGFVPPEEVESGHSDVGGHSDGDGGYCDGGYSDGGYSYAGYSDGGCDYDDYDDDGDW